MLCPACLPGLLTPELMDLLQTHKAEVLELRGAARKKTAKLVKELEGRHWVDASG